MILTWLEPPPSAPLCQSAVGFQESLGDENKEMGGEQSDDPLHAFQEWEGFWVVAEASIPTGCGFHYNSLVIVFFFLSI